MLKLSTLPVSCFASSWFWWLHSDECTMWNIYERDNLGRRTEFHLSAILKHLVRNNAVVLVDDGKNKCSVKNHFVSFNVLLVSISFVWFIGKDNGFGVILAKKNYTTIKTFSFLQTKTCQREMPKTQFAKRIWFFRGKEKPRHICCLVFFCISWQ